MADSVDIEDGHLEDFEMEVKDAELLPLSPPELKPLSPSTKVRIAGEAGVGVARSGLEVSFEEEKEDEELQLRHKSARSARVKQLFQLNSARVTPSLSYEPVYLRDPREFVSAGYDKKLLFSSVKLLVVVTMYNEPADELALTLRGICENLKYWTSKFEDDLSWTDIGVVIISDGREKLNPGTAQLMQEAGLFDPSSMAMEEDMSGLGCHMFQCIASFYEDEELKHAYPKMQTIFALKEHNGQKLDSHWWFIEAFAAALNPKYLLFLDVGVRLLKEGMFNVYRCMERNSQIGGLSGELVCREVGSTSCLIAGQYFEYKVSTLLDRSLESLSGFLSVLPGCLSAYRLSSIQGAPVRKYFYYLEHKNERPGVWQSLLYLGEDRLLCFDLVVKEGQNNVMHYSKDVVGEIDVCLDVVEMLKQRRRWINSTAAILVFYLYSYYRVLFHKEHSIPRKLSILGIFLIYLMTLLSAWLSLGIQIVFTLFNLKYLFADYPIVAYSIQAIYGFVIAVQFASALTPGKLDKRKWLYDASSAFLGCLFTVNSISSMYYGLTYGFFTDKFHAVVMLSFLAIIGGYFAVALIHGEFLTISVTLAQYWPIIPTYMYLISIYSVCNVHDMSWGTKSSNVKLFDDEEEAKKLRWKRNALRMRNIVLALYVAGNAGIVALGFWSFSENENEMADIGFISYIGISLLVYTALRLAASVIFVILNKIHKVQERGQHWNEVKMRRQTVSAGQSSVQEPETLIPKETSFGYMGRSLKEFAILNLVKRSTWFGILCVLVINMLFAFIGFVWCSCTVVMLLLARITPFFNYVFVFCAKSWRVLANADFSYGSFDGSIATLLRGPSKRKSGTGTLVGMDIVPLDDESSSNEEVFDALWDDHMTWKSLFYFLYTKPTVTAFSMMFCYGLFAVSLSLIVVPWVHVSMPNYWYLNWSLRHQILSTILGGIGLLFSISVTKFLDSNSRRVVNMSIGVQPLLLRQTTTALP